LKTITGAFLTAATSKSECICFPFQGWRRGKPMEPTMKTFRDHITNLNGTF